MGCRRSGPYRTILLHPVPIPRHLYCRGLTACAADPGFSGKDSSRASSKAGFPAQAPAPGSLPPGPLPQVPAEAPPRPVPGSPRGSNRRASDSQLQSILVHKRLPLRPHSQAPPRGSIRGASDSQLRSILAQRQLPQGLPKGCPRAAQGLPKVSSPPPLPLPRQSHPGAPPEQSLSLHFSSA